MVKALLRWETIRYTFNDVLVHVRDLSKFTIYIHV